VSGTHFLHAEAEIKTEGYEYRGRDGNKTLTPIGAITRRSADAIHLVDAFDQ
jgi:hypothetical protein